MAQVISTAPEDSLHDGELDTLNWLQDALPDGYLLFAGLEWAATHTGGNSYFGEIDFAIVGPSGRLLLIEQKNGGLRVENGDLVKGYKGVGKSVGRQARRCVSAVMNQWQKQHTESIQIDCLIFLPDYRVSDISAVHLDGLHLVDANTNNELANRIMDLTAGEPNPEQQLRVQQFLIGVLNLTLDIGSCVERQERAYRVALDTTWSLLQSLQCDPWRVRIAGRAGSGKTQIAWQLFNACIQQAGRPLYVCFNRPLADALSKWFPVGGTVITVDRLTQLYMHDDTVYDFEDLTALFPRLREQAMAIPQRADWLFDTVIIDEGQDFSPQQATFVERFVKPDGKLLWLEDDMQRLFPSREAAAPVVTASFRLQNNHRSPRTVVQYANFLLKLDPPDSAASPIAGDDPLIEVVANELLLERIEHHVHECLQQGFATQDIVVLSLRGWGGCSLRDLDALGGINVKKFSGEYNDEGEQIYSEGDLQVDSIYRYKGLQAQAVILCDIDAAKMDDSLRHRLYVGMTRARYKLVMLVSPAAAQVLTGQSG